MFHATIRGKVPMGNVRKYERIEVPAPPETEPMWIGYIVGVGKVGPFPAPTATDAWNHLATTIGRPQWVKGAHHENL